MNEEANANAEAAPEAAAGATEESPLIALLKERGYKEKFRPRDEQAEQKIVGAVEQLVAAALEHSDVISADASKTIKAIIAKIDEKIAAQMNEILHHEEFQKLEGSWRGLYHLVNNTETSTDLKIKVFNVSKKELGDCLKKFSGANWDQSPIFRQVYGGGFDQWGGDPFGCLVGDYYFNHDGPDVQLIREMAKIASAAHSPFITGADPSLMQMHSWQELSNLKDVSKVFELAEYAPWKSLRESEDSRYVGVAMPRFLSRQPYGTQNPVDEFHFEEDTAGAEHDKFTWSNAAYAMAANITAAYKHDGWCARIRGINSGGSVYDLPVHTFATDDGGQDIKCPTEVLIGDRREKELADAGFMPLMYKKGSDQAAFIGAQSLQLPTEYQGEDGDYATANANISARLPYLFASCRFAHFLKAIVREQIGTYKEREDLEQMLQKWIGNYVCDPKNAGEELRAQKPLAAAKVEVREDERNPGYYSSVFRLRPHYQLEGLDVSLRLVARLPEG